MSGDHQSKITLGPGNPWPGLNQFIEDHDRYFRGRDEEKLELFRLVKSATLTILFGKSGLGKSSLLQAGLFPLLRQAGYLPVLIHIRHDDLATDDRDGASPLGSQVYTALQDACLASKVEAPQIRDEERLWEYFHRAGADFWNERNRLVTPVLVFDQFEEAFTLGIENDRRRKRRDAFLAQLEELIENRPPQTVRQRWDEDPERVTDFEQDRTPCKIIVSLREDFLPDLEQLKEGIRSIMQNRFRLERMDGGKAWQVVTGETLIDGEPRRTLSHLVDEDVALKIIDFVSKTRGQRDQSALTRETLRARTVDPALLSVVCSELNNRRTAKKPPQEKISFTLLSDSKEEIIREFFDSHVSALGAGAGPVRRFIEEDLITGGGFRKRCDLDDALRQPGVTRDDLRRLEQQRILRFEPSEGITWIELTHDLLTEVVYASRRQRREREGRANADAAAAEKKKKMLFYAGLAFLAVVVAVLWWRYTIEDGLRKEAQGEKEKAQREREQAFKYFVRYAAEKIDHLLSEQPPNTASAQLFDLGAKSVFPDFPYADYASAISTFGELPLFQPELILDFGKPIRQMAYSADGQLGLLDEDGNFRILDVNAIRDRKILESTPPIQKHVASFSFHPRGKPIVALRGWGEETAILLNYEDKKDLKQIALPLGASIQPIGTTGSQSLPQSPTAVAWERAGPESQETPLDKEEIPMGIAFSPYSVGGDLLAIAAGDKTVRIFSIVDRPSGEGAKGVEFAEVARTRFRPASPSGGEDDNTSDAVLPDNQATGVAFIQIGPVPQLVTSNTAGVWVWPTEASKIREFKGELTHERLVRPAVVKQATGTPNEGVGRKGPGRGTGSAPLDSTSSVGLGTGGLGRVLCIAPYEATNGAHLFRDNAAWPEQGSGEDDFPLRLPDPATAAACAPDGQLIAVGVKSGGVYIFRGGEMLQRLDHNAAVRSIAFRPDARALASSSSDNAVRLWSFSRNGQPALESQPVFAKIVALSPDGHWLASLEDHRICLRDAATGKHQREATADGDPVVALAVDNEGQVIKVLSNGNEVTRWLVFSSTKTGTWHAQKILSVSPDAKWAVCTRDSIGFDMVDADTGDSKPIVLHEAASGAGKGTVPAKYRAFAISHSGGLIAAYDASAKKIALFSNPWLPAARGTAAIQDADPETLEAYTHPWRPDPPSVALKRTIPSQARLTHLAFAPNQRFLFATTQENDLLLFDLNMGRQLFRREAGGAVAALSTGGAQSKVACAFDDQPVRVRGGTPPPDQGDLEKIAGVTFEDFDLIKRPESDPTSPITVPLDATAAAFWDAFWDTRSRVAKLTEQSSPDDLKEAYAPIREFFTRGNPVPASWQASAMQQRLALIPPWASTDAAALRARLETADGLPPLERLILLRDGILPFAKNDPLIRATTRFRLAVERMNIEGEGLDRVNECREVVAAGYTDVGQILALWPIKQNARYAEIFEMELLPRVPEDRKADRAKLFIAIAEAHLLKAQGSALERLLSAALDRDPKSYMANFQYARALCAAARSGSASWDDATTAFDRAIALADSPAERAKAQIEKGKLWNDAHEWQKALDAFDAALMEEPSNRVAKQMRLTVLTKLGQPKQ